MCKYCEDDSKEHIAKRRDSIYGTEFIAVRHVKPCKANPNRNFFCVDAYINGSNMYAKINFCPMCGRKLGK